MKTANTIWSDLYLDISHTNKDQFVLDFCICTYLVFSRLGWGGVGSEDVENKGLWLRIGSVMQHYQPWACCRPLVCRHSFYQLPTFLPSLSPGRCEHGKDVLRWGICRPTVLMSTLICPSVPTHCLAQIRLLHVWHLFTVEYTPVYVNKVQQQAWGKSKEVENGVEVGMERETAPGAVVWCVRSGNRMSEHLPKSPAELDKPPGGNQKLVLDTASIYPKKGSNSNMKSDCFFPMVSEFISVSRYTYFHCTGESWIQILSQPCHSLGNFWQSLSFIQISWIYWEAKSGAGMHTVFSSLLNVAIKQVPRGHRIFKGKEDF